MTIEPVDPGHPEVRRLIELSDAYLAALYPAESNHLLDIASLRRPEIRFLGCRIDGRIVGCGAVRLCEDDGRYGEIKRVFVDEAFRGRGLSRRIMEELEAGLRAAGIGLARLETGIHQPEAIGLYKALGYRERGPFGGYRVDPLSLFMEKDLGADA